MTFSRRLALMIVLILIAAAGATPALAGEYPVYACEPTYGDVNNSWHPYSSHAAMSAYTSCTAADRWEPIDGIITRAAVLGKGSRVPAGAHASMTFRAPPGASINRITYEHQFCGWSGYLAGIADASGAWIALTGPASCGLWPPSPFTQPVHGTTALELRTHCLHGPCSTELGPGAPWGYAAMRSATVYVQDWTTPAISLTGGSALAAGWRSGTIDLVVAASDNVGISEVRIDHASAQLGKFATDCDFTLPVPCPNLDQNFGINSRAVPDGPQTLVITARDTAGNTGSASLRANVDNTAPGAPLDVLVQGGIDWRRHNGFSVSWNNPPQRDTAPIAGAEVAVCPSANDRHNWNGCSFSRHLAPGVNRVSGLHVPSTGDWEGRIWLRDAAGNASRDTAQVVPLRLDQLPPEVGFRPLDPADPTRLDVHATDTTSPIADGEVEFRRRGSSSWTPLATERTSNGFSARLNDERLADGVYDLRARARDSAGNEQSTDRGGGRSTGASRTLPLRIRTRLIAGQRRGRSLVVRPTTVVGQRTTIRGRLTMPGVNPLANGAIEVWERMALPGAASRRIAVVISNAQGHFTFKAVPGPTRVLRFRYPGTELVRAQTTEVKLRVRARSSIQTSRARVVNGDEIVLSGRLRGGLIPSIGKLVHVQAFSRGKWLTFGSARASARSGKWRYRYRFTATRGTVSYRFRVRIPAEAGYPYTAGTSRSSLVVVRGL